MKKRIVILCILGVLSISNLTACANNSNINSTNTQTTNINDESALKEINVNLNDITDSTYEITEEGNYILSGDYNGTIEVNSDDDITLTLNGVNIKSTEGPCILVTNASNLKIYSLENTTNYLEDTTNNLDYNAVIFSKVDLELMGNGSLTINSNNKNGIQTKANLLLRKLNINITSVKNGIVGKDSILIDDSTITIESENDGIKTTNEEDSSLGYIDILNGTFNISSNGDAISAASDIIIEDGEFNISTNGGAENSDVKNTNNDFKGPNNPNNNEMKQPMDMDNLSIEDLKNMIPNDIDISSYLPDGKDSIDDLSDDELKTLVDELKKNMRSNFDNNFNPQENEINENIEDKKEPPMDNNSMDKELQEDTTNKESNNEEDVSTKGIKANNNISINKGTFTIDSYDDAIHSNGDINILNGTFNISSGDDAIHADGTLTIDNGEFNISLAYEGLEGNDIILNDGSYNILTMDDGINGMEKITINDGDYYILASNNDAIDSNGKTNEALVINGGNIIAIGSNAPEEGIDSDDIGVVINGGYILGVGGSSSSVNENSTQANLSILASMGNKLEIYKDEELVYSFDLNNTNNLNNGSFLLSIPEFELNNSYTIKIDDKEIGEYNLEETNSSDGNTDTKFMGMNNDRGPQREDFWNTINENTENPNE